MNAPHHNFNFTPVDWLFITDVLAMNDREGDALIKLFTDIESLDKILDDPRLFEAILNRPQCVTISPQLYFYILARQVLLKAKINESILAKYLSDLLADFAGIKKATTSSALDEFNGLNSLSDLLALLPTANEPMKFTIQVYIGNYILFMTGIFPEYIQQRTERRAAPQMYFYEHLGSVNYRSASKQRRAFTDGTSEIFWQLSEMFHVIRLALNELADRLVFIESPRMILA